MYMYTKLLDSCLELIDTIISKLEVIDNIFGVQLYQQCPNFTNTKFQSFKVYFNNIPEGHIPMWIYIMYAGMSTGKYNDK